MFIKEIITFLFIIHVVTADETTQCPNIKKRAQWGARQATGINHLILPIPYVVISHTVTEGCTRPSQCAQKVANIQAYHMDSKNFQDISYSFLIGGDGNVYEGRGWTREGSHTPGYNRRSVGISFIGSYEDDDASQTMLDAAHKLITCGKAQGILQSSVRVIGARQVVATASPGFALYNQIQTWSEWASIP